MNLNLYLIDQYPGESLMLKAIDEAVSWNREACRTQDERMVCWLHREEREHTMEYTVRTRYGWGWEVLGRNFMR